MIDRKDVDPEVLRGADVADTFWNYHRRNFSLQFMAGFVSKLLMLVASSYDEETALRIGEAALSGLRRASVTQPGDSKH